MFNPLSLGFGAANSDLSSPSPSSSHRISPKVGSDLNGGAASTAHIAQPEGGDLKSGKSPASDLFHLALDPFNNIGITSTLHAYALKPNDYSPKTTNNLGNEATFLPDALVIGSSTLEMGSSPVTISGIAVSLASTAMVIGSKTLPLPPTQQVVTSIAGSQLIYHPPAVAIKGKTLTPGYLLKTLSEAVEATDSSGHLDYVTTLPPQEHPVTSNPRATGLGRPRPSIAINSDGNIVIGPSTLSPGATGRTIHEVSISEAPDHHLVLRGTTLFPGGNNITVDGMLVTVATDGAIVVDGATLHLGGAGVPFGSTASNGDLRTDGSTFSPGGHRMLVDGMPISIASGGEIILDGTTLTSGGAEMTFDGSPISVASDGSLLLGGTTLNPEAFIPATHDGTTVPVNPDGTSTSTILTASSADLGALIAGASGDRPTASLHTDNSSPAAVTSKGGAVRSRFKLSPLIIVMLSAAMAEIVMS